MKCEFQVAVLTDQQMTERMTFWVISESPITVAPGSNVRTKLASSAAQFQKVAEGMKGQLTATEPEYRGIKYAPRFRRKDSNQGRLAMA